jgi:metal-responsive CopG/Arc/MetJ family transcriptional regulator
MNEKMVHIRLPTDLLAKLDHAAAVWTLDEINSGSQTKHTRSSILREAAESYLGAVGVAAPPSGGQES